MVSNITFKALANARYAYRYHNTTNKLLANRDPRNIKIPKSELDIEYLCSPKNKAEIEQNIKNRKGVGDIARVHGLYNQLQNNLSGEQENKLFEEFEYEASQIPNKSSPLVSNYGSDPKVISVTGTKKEFDFKPKEFSEILTAFHVLRTENLSNLAGHKSYYFMGGLAQLEHALVRFSVKNLLARGFQLVSVPDLLPAQIIENCGMNTRGERTQIYKLDTKLYNKHLCLSGTSEMALAAFVMNKEFSKLPLRFAAVSRCYRAETSGLAEEKGIYRVHQFTKVEMFGVTSPEGSNKFLEELKDIQEEMYSSLGLHFHTLDMPPCELGAPAFRKFDIEAWMPGRKMFGEISSCSDCTDYQSRRLMIKYRPHGSTTPIHAHTVNGTACAVPRMMIALCETHQQADGTIEIPKPLQCFMGGKTTIGQEKSIPPMKYIKSKA